MPLSTFNVSWPDQNSQRRYPLAASANGVDQTGSFVLPNDFILALYLPVSTGFDGDSGQFFIYQLGMYANGFNITIGYQPASGSPVVVATALFSATNHIFGDSYDVGGTGNFLSTFGRIQIGNLDNIGLQPQGLWTFDFESTRLEPGAILPMTSCLAGLRVRTGNNVSQLLTGIVELVADANMQITPILVEGQNPILQFSAISGAGLNQTCACEEDAGNPILTLNLVGPDPSGNLNIVGDDCIEITPIANGLQLRDTCSAPCCACQALEAVNAGLEALQVEAQSIQNFQSSLQTSVDTMNMIVLGSRLNDQGCAT